MLKTAISLRKGSKVLSLALRNKGNITPKLLVDPIPGSVTDVQSAWQSTERTTNQVTRVKDLPKETLYIFDGTAMLYHAHHSRENSFRHADATLTPELSIELCNRLQLDMKAYIAEKNSIASKGNTAYSSSAAAYEEDLSQPKDRDEDMIPLSCGALVGMATRFARFVRDVRPSYIAVAFDAGGKTFRDLIDNEYKANRQRPPLALLPLFGMAPQVIEELGARCFQKSGYEADDIMASLSAWARRQGFQVVLISGDKDMLQLVDSAVHVMNPFDADRSLIGSAEILEKYQVHAHQLVDFFALVGDGADNIAGVRGVGPKAAAILLRHFGDIESMISALKLPSEAVDLTCALSVASAGLEIEDVPSKATRKAKTKSVAGSAATELADAVSRSSTATSAGPSAESTRVKFGREAEEHMAACFAREGARGSPRALLEKLLRTGAQQLRKFKSLVKLHKDFHPEQIAIGRYIARQSDPVGGATGSAASGSSQLTTEYFRYSGEREHTAAANLLAMSEYLGAPLQLLRRHSPAPEVKG